MNNTLFFWVSRVSSILISYTALAFFTEATFPTGFAKNAVAILVGLIGTLWVLYNAWHRASMRMLTLLPFGFWLGLASLYLLGGFPQLSVVEFLFLSLLAGSLTWLSFYSWSHSALGGVVYVSLGFFYMIIAFSRVQIIALIFVVAFLWQTGILFMLVDQRKISGKDIQQPAKPQPHI